MEYFKLRYLPTAIDAEAQRTQCLAINGLAAVVLQ